MDDEHAVSSARLGPRRSYQYDNRLAAIVIDVPVEVPSVPLGSQQRHHLLMAVKEACNNVVRHAEASEVWVRLQLAPDGVGIMVEDNGRGFAVEPKVEGQDGLRIMRQRMNELGGRIEKIAVELKDLDALGVAHDLLVAELSGPAR